MQDQTIDQLKEAADYIKTHYPEQPEAAIVLGSGLGNLAEEITVTCELDYRNIPYFRVSTVMGHSGKLVFGNLSGKKVVAMSGRFHYYEGYTPQQVVFPIRVMKMLGVRTLLISNAAGGMNSTFKVGDLMIIKDHISLFVPNPLIGINYEELGLRFPDMSGPYDKKLIAIAKKISERSGIELKEGIYAGVTGPTFETRAEYRLLHLAGGDAVGMSTVQEVIAAVQAGMNVFAMSVITDLGIREEENTITHEEVLEAAARAEPRLAALFKLLVAEL
jgi:purine-nucleoside phosphorylase